MPDPMDRAFGQAAVRMGCLSRAALEEELRSLQRRPGPTSLPDHLVAQGLLAPEQVARIRAALGMLPARVPALAGPDPRAHTVDPGAALTSGPSRSPSSPEAARGPVPPPLPAAALPALRPPPAHATAPPAGAAATTALSPSTLLATARAGHPSAAPVPSHADARPGRRFGKFQILEELGRGGMGVVYKAYHTGLRCHVALKVLLAGVDASAEEAARFRREAEAAARLRHPGIVAVHDIGEEEGKLYIAMEFVEGRTLDRVLQAPAEAGIAYSAGPITRSGKSGAARMERGRRGHPLPAKTAARMAQEIAEALQAAHDAGVIHRDLKPGNVMLGAGGRLKVMDFGLAKMVDADRSGGTRTGSVLGTPAYMSPEQAEGRVRAIGPRSDVYQIGAIFFELLTGRPPYEGDSSMDILLQVLQDDPPPPRKLAPSIDPDAETICLTCLARDPARRYASAAALAADLARYQSGEPISARPRSSMSRLVRQAGRHRPTVVSAALAALLAVVTLWALFGRPDTSSTPSSPAPEAPGTAAPAATPAPPPTAPVPAAVLPALDARARDAQGFLAALAARTDEAGTDLAQLALVEQRYQEFMTRFKNTEWEARGLAAHKTFADRLERAAEPLVAERKRKSDAAVEADRLGEAIEAYDGMPPILEHTAAAARAADARAGLSRRLEDRWAADQEEIRKRIEAGDYDAAVETLRRIVKYGLPAQRTTAEARIPGLERERDRVRSEKATAAQGVYEREFLPAFEKQLRSGAFDAACTCVREAQARDPLRFLPEPLAQDLADAQLLVAARKSVREIFEEASRAGRRIKVGGLDGKIVVHKDGYGLEERGEAGGTITKALDIERFDLKQIAALLGLRHGDDTEAAGPMTLGLLAYYADERKNAEDALRRAATLYAQAGESGRAARANDLLRRLAGANAAAAEDQAVRDLLAQARAAWRERRYDDCLKRIAELRGKHPAHAEVARAQAELTELEKKCGAAKAAAVAQPPAGAPAPAPQPGLVAWWAFDEGSGSVAKDLSGNGYDGVISNARYETGVRGTALRFDGMKGRVEIKVAGPLQSVTAGPHTLAAWIFLETVPRVPKFVIDFSGAVGQGFDQRGLRFLGNAFPVFKWVTAKGSKDLRSDVPLVIKVWHHVAGVYDAAGATLYVDGVAQGTRASEGAPTGIQLLTLGDVSTGGTGDGVLCGMLDEVKIFTRALSAPEVAALARER